MAHVHWSLGTRGQRPEHINGCGQGSNVTQQTFRVSGTRNDWIQLTRNDPIASALNVTPPLAHSPTESARGLSLIWDAARSPYKLLCASAHGSRLLLVCVLPDRPVADATVPPSPTLGFAPRAFPTHARPREQAPRVQGSRAEQTASTRRARKRRRGTATRVE